MFKINSSPTDTGCEKGKSSWLEMLKYLAIWLLAGT